MDQHPRLIDWSSKDPLIVEISDAAKQAFFRRNLAPLEQMVEDALDAMPQPFRFFYRLHWRINRWWVHRKYGVKF